MGIIDRNIEELKKLCTLFNVEKMYLFGSILNANFNKESDIDFLADLTQPPAKSRYELKVKKRRGRLY
jgi:predicted nucleotidyltransferase